MSPTFEPLPDVGLHCIEASAGTGKTHRLSTLAARWLVERDDLRPTDLLVVTFTVAASLELRARIRERLVSTRSCLLHPAGDTPDDLAWCRDAGDPEVLVARVERALAGFDSISISTIHGFAAAALGGTLGDVDVADARRRQAVTDVLAVSAFDEHDVLLRLPRAVAGTLDAAVRLSLENPDALLAPLEGAAAPEEVWAHLGAVERTVARFEARGRRDGFHTYADLLTELHAALDDDASPLLATLRARYAVGLIDEFQDTDPFQWGIFRRIFLDAPGRTLVVVGDPKQAIYGFRGADVDTYLAARTLAESAGATAPGVENLTTNFRSDRAMLRTLNALFDGSAFDEGRAIRYVEVAPSPDAPDRGIVLGDASPAPLSVRVLTWATSADERHRAIAEDCADEASALLSATILDGAGSPRDITERDVVVLCRGKTHFPILRAAFLRRGIRTTEAKTDDVLDSVAALDVAVALRAMSQPTNAGAVAAVAHCWLGTGAASDDDLAVARRRIVAWNDALTERGIASFVRLVTDPAATPGLLARLAGERLLTDLHHVCDVLAAAAPHGAGAVQLLETLGELRATTRSGDDDLRTRRIDTDEPAIRLMTIHGSKGLEFPVVLCPFVQNFMGVDKKLAMWRDTPSGSRLLDAGGGMDWTDPRLAAPSPKDRSARVASAEASENRRLLYVALTRAKHRTSVWWERRAKRAEQCLDELTGLLLDRDEAGRVVQRPRVERASGDATAYDVDGAGALAQLARHFAPLLDAGDLELVEVTRPSTRRVAQRRRPGRPAPTERATLSVATIDRDLSERARRCSFSSLVASSHGSDPLDPAAGDADADDEVAAAPDGGPLDARDGDVVDPFGGLSGTAFGSAVHEGLEAALSRRPTETFEAAAAEGLAAASRRLGVEARDEALAGLLQAAAAPIGEFPPLRELEVADASTELRFQLPVAGDVGVQDVARTLLAHRGAGPFGDWATRLADLVEPMPLAAALVGSIDLVSTLGTKDRFFVLDYKTNVPGPYGFGATGLRSAMGEADYPLQALLYLVALHRMLAWRLDGYDPERHLGGAHYLFLRGMRPGTDAGVVSWSPGARAVCAVSDLFAGAA